MASPAELGGWNPSLTFNHSLVYSETNNLYYVVLFISPPGRLRFKFENKKNEQYTQMNNPETWMPTNFPRCKHIDAHGFERSGMPKDVQEWVRQNWVADTNGNPPNQWTVYHKRESGGEAR